MFHSLRMQAGLLVRAAASPVQTVKQLRNPSMMRGFHAYWLELRRAAIIDALALLVLFLIDPRLAAGAILFVIVAAVLIAWQGRSHRGVEKGWPPGKLGVGVRPLTEADHFMDGWRRHGPVFKTHFFNQPMVAVVGMRAGAELLQDPTLEPIRLQYNQYIPNNLIRWMTSPTHENYRRVLAPLLGARLPRQSQWRMDAAVERGLSRMASAGRTGPSAVELPRIARDLVFETWVPMLLGVEPDTDRFRELQRQYEVINVSAPHPHADVVRALARIEALIRANEAERTAATERGETPPLCALTELWRLRSEGLDEQTTLRNVIYLTETTGHDAAGVLMWLLKHLGNHPQWLQALRESGEAADAPEPLASSGDRDGTGQRGLANRIISETMRLEQSEFILRQTTTEIRFRGFVIPKGWAIRVCTQESHRDPELFPEPNRFNPDRFLNANRDGDYAPFGLNDRSCTGANMTRALARTFICELANRYDLAVLADGPRTLSLHRHWAPGPDFRVSVTPRG